MSAIQPEVVVVGAGPVGLTMACELARHGIRFRIIDKLAEPTDKSKALVVWTRTLEIFETMGVAKTIIERGLAIHGVGVFADHRRVVHVTLDELESQYPFAINLAQSETERTLREHLETFGHVVERETPLTGFQQDGGGVDVTLSAADGTVESLRVDWLIGCDGAHSVVRHALDLPFEGYPEENDWALADVRISGGLHDDEVSVYWHRSGVLALFPFHPGRVRVVADLGPRQGDAPPTPTLEQMQSLVEERAVSGLTLHDPVWLSGFRINERKVESYGHERVFLCGDAAHIHSPAGGQGMNTGIQDAYNLAWKLALVLRKRAPRLLLDSYSHERSAIGAGVLRATQFATRAATLRNPVAQHLRNDVVRFLASLEVVQQRLKNTATELSLNYHDSPISHEHRGPHSRAWALSHGVRAGDRAPDGEASDGLRLFDRLDALRFNLLLMEGLSPDSEGLEDLRKCVSLIQSDYADTVSVHWIASGTHCEAPHPDQASYMVDGSHQLHRKYAATHTCLYLLRPDGYVGFRSMPADPSILWTYLQLVLVASI